MNFIRYAWYVAGWSADFGRALTSRMVIDEPLVLFGQRNDELEALNDRCPLRSAAHASGRGVG
ncbi:MAG: Rieske 2Fe-2S domain-containing protein [Gammaproteobacteria bacterium]